MGTRQKIFPHDNKVNYGRLDRFMPEFFFQKRSKRATDRWLKLTKGLIIRERVKKKFSLAESLKDWLNDFEKDYLS